MIVLTIISVVISFANMVCLIFAVLPRIDDLDPRKSLLEDIHETTKNIERATTHDERQDDT